MFFFHVVGRFLPGKSLSTGVRRDPRLLPAALPGAAGTLGEYRLLPFGGGFRPVRAASRRPRHSIRRESARGIPGLTRRQLNTNKSPRPRVNVTHLGLRFW
jgi:hypothetical protein